MLPVSKELADAIRRLDELLQKEFLARYEFSITAYGRTIAATRTPPLSREG